MSTVKEGKTTCNKIDVKVTNGYQWWGGGNIGVGSRRFKLLDVSCLIHSTESLAYIL